MSTTLIKMINVVAILMFTAMLGCEHFTDNKVAPGQNSSKTGQNSSKKGLGSSTELPVGKKFSLLDGITLVGETIPAFNKYECDCKQGEACERGSGGLVKVCLNFQNTTNKPIAVTLPLGLIFVSISEKVQNGLLLKVEKFEVPADGTMSIGLNLYCLNSGREVPARFDKFVMGPITENAEVAELARLIDGKDLGSRDNGVVIQRAVWGITDKDGLTREIREDLTRMH